ncbi:KamA family protein [uncultured Alphaproteobacteria bacterium]|uniref:KamA family protein n=1 Tax=uncultured Alphaproteobacteria bacterium TaxID=91750 RepID=A0A212J4E8_9PROT|nr:KamA family protein [uncultured Alphaproteobacteria bacterium]
MHEEDNDRMPRKRKDDVDWTSLDWKAELSNNVVTVDRLKTYVSLGSEEEEAIREVVKVHPLNVSRYYLSLIDPADPHDPIRKMCVPSAEELVVAGSMGNTTPDPYGDDKHDKGNGVLHKYDYSILLVTTETCATYCRHCFRKRIVGRPTHKTLRDFSNALAYIADHPEVDNVILSGGDPLTLPTPILRDMLTALAGIDHLKFLRIGSRIPVTYPLRLLDDSLIDLLGEINARKALYVPTHFNHAREITPVSTEAIRRLRRCGITVNNQAVLLRGVNDTPDALVDLMNGLLSIGVNPYYLYQCMPVSRVRHHFQIPLRQAVAIVDAARARLNGYGKRFKFIIGHDIGKLEICGISDDRIVLKQIHARSGHAEQASRILMQPIDGDAGWVTF